MDSRPLWLDAEAIGLFAVPIVWLITLVLSLGRARARRAAPSGARD